MEVSCHHTKGKRGCQLEEVGGPEAKVQTMTLRSEESKKTWEAALSDSVMAVPGRTKSEPMPTRGRKKITWDNRNSPGIGAQDLTHTLKMVLSDLQPGPLKFF